MTRHYPPQYPALQGGGNCERNLFGFRTVRITKKSPTFGKQPLPELRDWVIYNFLLNAAAGAATVSAIQIRDVDLDGGVVFYRHTKNRKTQVIPLCSAMVSILREYLRHRGGEAADFLFCTETGSQLTENGLRQSIARYNTQRGVQKTKASICSATPLPESI